MSIVDVAKRIGISHNVSIRVLDVSSGKVIQEHTGHNAATNSMLLGIGHYLKGDGVLNQGYHMLSHYVPRYISLGTMGLAHQDEEVDPITGQPTGSGLPGGITDYVKYMKEVPGYGADGYDASLNNHRLHFGLGPAATSYDYTKWYDVGAVVTFGGCWYECIEYAPPGGWDRSKWKVLADQPAGFELISPTCPRSAITYRDIFPETESEVAQTIDVVYSAMISTGALAQFREPGKDYIYITEAGLWSRSDYIAEGGDNGLLAGYRIAPPNKDNWAMEADISRNISETDAANNRKLLQQQILRVGTNQVVQVIWKVQLGSIDQLQHHDDRAFYWQDFEKLKAEESALEG